VRDYPYAEDGLLLWEALQRYFTAYVGLYYADDAAVKKDTWLQEW
jgi:lipoxygenase